MSLRARILAGAVQQIRHVIRERASDQEFHRQVIHELWVLARVRLCGEYPTARERVSDRAGEGLELVAWRCRARVDGLLEKKMALIDSGSAHFALTVHYRFS